ncbi:MAG: VWA domain-containing protein [Acidobacteriota bacterium]
MRITLAVLLAAVLAGHDARAAETAPPLVRSVEISITNVDVVVTDAKGRPVTDLTPFDFVVKQEGKTQTISNFSFVRNLAAPAAPLAAGEAPSSAAAAPATAAPAPAGARIVVLLDLLHMTTGNRNRTLASLAEFLPKTIGPRVEVQIVTWDRALRTRGPFTNDANVLTAVLSALKDETALGEAPARERSRLFSQIDTAFAADPRFREVLIDQAISTLRGWCDAQASDIDATLDAARALTGTVSGLEGRKILIFATEKLTPSPGREIWDYLMEGVDRLSRSSGGQRVTSSPTSVTGLTWKDFDRTESFQRFAEVANGAGVSLFMVDAAGLQAGDTRLSSEFAGTGDSVNEGIATLDAESALHLLADETGGAAIIGRNNLALALESLEPAWTAYYSLGFESGTAKPGVPRSIRVSVKRPGVRVLTRRNVVERTTEQKVADTVLSGVHFPKTINPLRASLHIGKARLSGKNWLLPLEFKVPFEKLTLIPQGGRLKGALLFTAAARTPDGRISPVSTERAPIDIPESDLSSLTGKVFTYASTIKVRPGPQIISAALTDEISHLSSYVQPHVVAGDEPAKR